ETGSGGTTGEETGSGGTTGEETGSGGTTGEETGSGGTTGGGVIVDASGLVFDDYVLDITAIENSGSVKLKGDASVVDAQDGSVIRFDGDGDAAKLGRLTEFEESEQLAFMIEFTRDEADGSSQRLIWNKGHLGLTLKGDGLVAHVADSDGKLKGFKVDDLGLNDTDTHKIIMLVDQESDRLQVLVDDVLVFEETDTDFEFVEGTHGGRQWGWNLGFEWGRYVDGEVSAFAIDDDVDFVNPTTFQGDDLFV
ncbi:MAG: hypothetical protein AAFN80_03460, partial [Pseudomonadota bacterium]